MHFEIINGVLYVYEAERDTPFLKQPTWPNGDAWLDGEAEDWAKQLILSLKDSSADLAGASRDAHPEPRVIEKDFAEKI